MCDVENFCNLKCVMLDVDFALCWMFDFLAEYDCGSVIVSPSSC